MKRRTSRALAVLNILLAPTLRTRRHPDRAWLGAVKKAERDSGIGATDADRQWIDDYQFLIDRIAEVPRLSPFGWQAILTEGSWRLANRLRIRDLHQKRPAIAAEHISEPIFVVGLPRTATTLAHNLLAGSPECRGPLAWEMMHTDLELDAETTARRIAKVRKQSSAARWAPDLDVVHPLRVESPEESMMLLPQGLYHTLIHAPMPEYRDWFLERDATQDYQYLKEALQVLQHGRPRRRWVLKYPLDLGEMSTIRRVFPDATFVWTHRDPSTVMGSLCSLADLLQSLYLTGTDRRTIGRFTLDLMVQVVNAGRDYRQKSRTSVVDVPYHHLVSDPTRRLPELHDRLGLPWSLADGERLCAAMERGRVERDRKHEYDLRSYGLAFEDVEHAFGDYQRWSHSINN